MICYKKKVISKFWGYKLSSFFANNNFYLQFFMTKLYGGIKPRPIEALPIVA
jgi:hypothetical protein